MIEHMWTWAGIHPSHFTVVAVSACISFGYSMGKIADALSQFAPWEGEEEEEEEK